MDINVFQQKLDYRLLDTLAKQTPLVVAGHITVAFMNILLFWSEIHLAFLLGWTVFVLGTVAWRWTMKTRYQRDWQLKSPRYWRWLFAASAVMLGAMWCVWGLYVGSAIDFDGAGLSILVITAAGLVSGAVASTSASLISYVFFAVPILLPLSAVLIRLDETQVQGIGVMMLLFFVITVRQVLQIHSVLKQSIKNSLELEESKEQTERLANELYQQSTMDALTSVTNRRGFDEALNAEWLRARRAQLLLTLVMIDADCFKAFNDSLGHPAGDECLKQLAATLRSNIKRAGETIARYGGEEFALLLPNTTAVEGVEIAETIRKGIFALNIPHPASDVADRVTVSAGVYCVIPDQADDSHKLIEYADQALYQAKADGRNCVRQA